MVIWFVPVAYAIEPFTGDNYFNRFPTNAETWRRKAVLHKLPDRRLAFNQRHTWSKYFRVVSPERNHTLNIATFGCRSCPLFINF